MIFRSHPVDLGAFKVSLLVAVPQKPITVHLKFVRSEVDKCLRIRVIHSRVILAVSGDAKWKILEIAPLILIQYKKAVDANARSSHTCCFHSHFSKSFHSLPLGTRLIILDGILCPSLLYLAPFCHSDIGIFECRLVRVACIIN